MYILIGEQEIELNTKLRTVKRIEQAFKMPLVQIFKNLEQATAEELIKILAIAADKMGGEQGQEFKRAVEEAWDYADLMLAVQELVARLQFSGTPEQVEAKINRFPMPEQSKNMVREMLGLPKKEIPADFSGEDY